MFQIIIGHIFGIIIAGLMPIKALQIEESPFFILLGVIVMLGFLYYQLYRSNKVEIIYWRGQIHKIDHKNNFLISQFGHSIPPGYFFLSFDISFIRQIYPFYSIYIALKAAVS